MPHIRCSALIVVCWSFPAVSRLLPSCHCHSEAGHPLLKFHTVGGWLLRPVLISGIAAAVLSRYPHRSLPWHRWNSVLRISLRIHHNGLLTLESSHIRPRIKESE